MTFAKYFELGQKIIHLFLVTNLSKMALIGFIAFEHILIRQERRCQDFSTMLKDTFEGNI